MSYQDNLKQYGQADPRKDKAGDHDFWEALLTISGTVRGYDHLYFNLHAFRCGGAELVPTESSLKITRGDWKSYEWNEKKAKYLEPNRDKVIELLVLARKAARIEGVKRDG